MKTVICLSGGMDSTSLLCHLLAQGREVYAISFNYGQKHGVELEMVQRCLGYLLSEGHEVHWRTVHMNLDLLKSALTSGDISVPVGHYEDENMKKTVVPNRNAIFSSIAYGYALSLVEGEEQVQVALGVHSGDHTIYPDCRPEFYHLLQNAFTEGNWNSDKVHFDLPFIQLDKTGILKTCIEACFKLDIEFDEVMRNTSTSYNPEPDGTSPGDTASDIERIEAFIKIGRKDPIKYAKPWPEIKEHAIKVLRNA